MEKQTIEIREETPEEKAQRNTQTLADIEAYFKESLRFAEGVLTVDYLTGEDRGAIEDAIHGIKHWLPVFLKSDEVTFVRQAGLRLAVYNSMIGARCEVTDSEAEYWRRRRCAKGGEQTNPAVAEWQRWVLEEMAKHPDVKPTPLADILRAKKSRPSNLPGRDHLVRFIRDERKRDKTRIRLVHSA
jgi:hypothetical protein